MSSMNKIFLNFLELPSIRRIRFLDTEYRVFGYGLLGLRIWSNDQYGVLGLKIQSIEVLVLSSSKSLDTAYSSRMIRRIDDMKKQMVKLPTLTATEEAISDVLLVEHGDKKMPILLCGKGIAITGSQLFSHGKTDFSFAFGWLLEEIHRVKMASPNLAMTSDLTSDGVKTLTTASKRSRLKRNPRRFGEA
ncbi:hypothetical protein Tco_1105403 [Tanacetum coccineum]